MEAVCLHHLKKCIVADKKAIAAAIGEPGSNGQTEGQITKLKLVKRQMYGRARLDLLRAGLVVSARTHLSRTAPRLIQSLIRTPNHPSQRVPARPGCLRARGDDPIRLTHGEFQRAAAARQMTLPTSSATSSPPRPSSATPTGRPCARPSASRNPLSTSMGSPFGLPSANATNTTR